MCIHKISWSLQSEGFWGQMIRYLYVVLGTVAIVSDRMPPAFADCVWDRSCLSGGLVDQAVGAYGLNWHGARQRWRPSSVWQQSLLQSQRVCLCQHSFLQSQWVSLCQHSFLQNQRISPTHGLP